jgi:hypothetical protein
VLRVPRAARRTSASTRAAGRALRHDAGARHPRE